LQTSLYGAGAEYALHSMLILATAPAPVSSGDLATYQGLPGSFLAKVFTRLKKAGLVRGTEGISGGFTLSRPAGTIAVLDILKAVDPGRALFTCAEIRPNCALFGAAPPAWAVSGPCRIQAFMEEAEGHLQAFLASRTLADLVCEFSCKAPADFAEATEDWFLHRKRDRQARRPAGASDPS
jgi:Rrf2 family protein